MADADKPIHRGNQAFIDEDYPATLQVSLVSSFSRRAASFGVLRTAVHEDVVTLPRGERVVFAGRGRMFHSLSLP